MPKEIANKTKEETYPIRELATSNGASYKCAHCGDKIFWNTHKKFTYCKCKKIWVDGCEDYVRVGGNEGDYKVITK
ncbi:MAG: hypothetical protein V1649_00085 [Patescibacteria group bacterium]